MVRAGLIGYPIEHSLSPEIHRTFFEKSGIHGEYLLWPLPDIRRLPGFIDAAARKKINGFNVTIPYKAAVIDYMDVLDGSAAAVGAVNTAVLRDGRWYGYNTDVSGVKHLVESNAVIVTGKKILIFGAGGAARAAVRYFADNQAEIYCAVRDTDSENSVHIRRIYDKIKFIKLEDTVWPDNFVDIVVNALPAAVSEGFFDKVRMFPYTENLTAAFDLNYLPRKTKFMKLFSKCHNVAGGYTMLLGQAAEAFRLWTGYFPDI